MSDSDYMMGFDLSELNELTDQIGRVSSSYTDLGSAVQAVSSTTIKDLATVQSNVSQVTSQLSILSSTLELTFLTLNQHLSSTEDILTTVAKVSKEIEESLTKVPQAMQQLAGQGAGVQQSVSERIQDIMPAGVSGVGASSEDLKEQQAAEKEDNAAVGREDKKQKKLKAIGLREAKNLKSGVMSLVSKASMGVVGGSFIAGSIAAMVLGAKDDDRKAAQKGEVKNAFEVFGEDLTSSKSKAIIDKFADFQETAQWQYAVGRKEVQAAIKQAGDAGYSMSEVGATFREGWGEVGKSIVHANIALDKHLNRASGSAMKEAIEISRNYGESLTSATSKNIQLNLAAQQSSMGIEKFTQSIQSSGSSLVQYGIDLKDIVVMTSQLEKHYKDMGLSDQYAGSLGAQAAQGISQGIGGFSDSMKAILANEMNLGQGYAGVVAFDEGWRRIKSGESDEMLKSTVKALARVVEKQGGETRSGQITALRKLGLNSLSASTFVDMKNSEGGIEGLFDGSDMSNKKLKQFKQSFETEGEQLSELQRNQRDIINSIAKIGQGLIGVIGNLTAVIVAAWRSLPALIDYAIARLPGGDDDKADRIMDSISGMFAKIGGGLEDSNNLIAEGYADSKDAFGQQLMYITGGSIHDAFNADLSGNLPGEAPDIAVYDAYEQREKAQAESVNADKKLEDAMWAAMYITLSKEQDAGKAAAALDVLKAAQAEAAKKAKEAESAASIATESAMKGMSFGEGSSMYGPFYRGGSDESEVEKGQKAYYPDDGGAPVRVSLPGRDIKAALDRTNEKHVRRLGE